MKCVKALKLRGLYGMFLVKTAHKQFPMQYLKDWAHSEDLRGIENNERVPWGTWKCLKNTVEGLQDSIIYALGYRDRKMKTLVSNKGTTLPGEPLVVERSRLVDDEDGRPVTEWYQKETPRPKMLQQYFDHFSCIDVHDHRRQGVFQIEKYWLTRKWWHRVFATVGIGMCFVDAYLAFKMDWQAHHNGEEVEDFLTYAGHLAYALIFNDYGEGRSPHREARGHQEPERPPQQVSVISVLILHISTHCFIVCRGCTIYAHLSRIQHTPTKTWVEILEPSLDVAAVVRLHIIACNVLMSIKLWLYVTRGQQ